MISVVLELITDWFQFFQMLSGIGWIVTIAVKVSDFVVIVVYKINFLF